MTWTELFVGVAAILMPVLRRWREIGLGIAFVVLYLELERIADLLYRLLVELQRSRTRED